MSRPTAKAILDREFLEMRSRILELAASLDRVQRAGEPTPEASWQQLRAAMNLLLSEDATRAEKVQMLFSRPYESVWREKLGVG